MGQNVEREKKNTYFFNKNDESIDCHSLMIILSIMPIFNIKYQNTEIWSADVITEHAYGQNIYIIPRLALSWNSIEGNLTFFYIL